MAEASTSVEIFCSYAHEDELWLRKLKTHLSVLKRQGLFSIMPSVICPINTFIVFCPHHRILLVRPASEKPHSSRSGHAGHIRVPPEV